MPPHPQTVPAATHEIYVWDAHELLEEASRSAHTATEWNEKLKQSIDADVVALSQLIKSGSRIARQIKLLGVTGRAYIKEVRGKVYIIFKGYAKMRPNLHGTRYLVDNPKVRCFVVGSKDILVDAAKATKVAVIAFVAIDVITELSSDHPSWASLGVQISSDVLQAALAAGAGAIAGALIIAAIPAAPVVIVYAVVIGTGFVAGMGLVWLDRHLKLTERAKARMKGYEDVAKAKLAILEQKAAITGRQALDFAQHAEHRAVSEIKAEYYRVDRYFSSLGQMIAADGVSYGFVP